MAWLWKHTEECVITLGFDYLSFGAACSIAITWRHSSGRCLMAHWPSFHLHPNLLLPLTSQKAERQHAAAQVLSLTGADRSTARLNTHSTYSFLNRTTPDCSAVIEELTGNCLSVEKRRKKPREQTSFI